MSLRTTDSPTNVHNLAAIERPNHDGEPIRRYLGRSSPYTYFVTVLSRFFINRSEHRQAARRTPDTVVDIFEARTVSSGDSADVTIRAVDGQTAADRLAVALAAALQRLGPADRLILRSHYVDDLPLNDIGNQLILAKRRVYQIHDRLLARLRLEFNALQLTSANLHAALDAGGVDRFLLEPEKRLRREEKRREEKRRET